MSRTWAAALVLLLAWPAAAGADTMVRIRQEAWTAADERGYGEFIARLGASNCRTVDGCLRNAANPFRASDPQGLRFEADCADLPYFLRFYYAWKRGLPFSYVSDVSPRLRSRDIRYSPRGNVVEARRDVLTGEDALFFTMLANGADGGILAASHLMTDRFVEVGRRFDANDIDGARRAWRPLAEFVPLLFAEANPMPIKYCLWREGLIASPECRLPLTRISDVLARRLDAVVSDRKAA